jgi:hypothetical protein
MSETVFNKLYKHFITYSGRISDCKNTHYDTSVTSPYVPPVKRKKEFEKSLAKVSKKPYN